MFNGKLSVFLTVGNKKQKELCEKIVSMTPGLRRYNVSVVSDDDYGHRLGSGGAVLNILHNYYKSGEKIVIVNSGGVSKRSVNYAVRSKAFANIEYANEVISLMELILINAEKIMCSVSSGVLVCCSDIVVHADKSCFDFVDNTGLCMETDFITASRHGVMLCDNETVMTDYYHKRSPEFLESVVGGNNDDGVSVDTGITYFTDNFSYALKELAESPEFECLYFRKNIELNLYSDIISLLSRNVKKEDYLSAETINEEHLKVKEFLFDRLSGFSMKVHRVKGERFLHFGTLKEAMTNIKQLSDKSKNFIKLNSFVDEKTTVGDNTLLDGVQLNGCRIGKGCMVTDISLDNISVSDGKSICGVRLCDGNFVALICDIEENPKDITGDISKWELPRFYKAKSFTESLEKYYSEAKEEKYSMKYCMDNVDFDYMYSFRQYISELDSYVVSENYLNKRREILKEYFSTIRQLDAINCLKDRVEICLPLRINLSGTWTDAMPYCVDNGGQVINMAVTLDGKLPVRVIVEKLNDNAIEFSSDGNKISFNNNYENEEDISDFNLHKAALKTVGINPETVIKDGFRLSTQVIDVDKGSGLGTSSILLGGCIMALNEMFGLDFDRSKILQAVFVAEQIMNTGGGWQDQVGGLTSGIKSGTTVAGISQDLVIDYIDLPESFQKMFSERMVLLPSGQRHFGRLIVNDVVNRYLSGNEESLNGHKAIRELNAELIKSINSEDEKAFYGVINEHRRLLKMISPKVTNSVLDDIVDACMEVACAVSPLGAGGGGYLLVVLKENITLQHFKEFVSKKFPWIKSPVKKPEMYFYP